jgi:outer membrane protein TolC
VTPHSSTSSRFVSYRDANSIRAIAAADFRSGAERRRTALRSVLGCLATLLTATLPCTAQISFTSAVNLALQNSPRVKIAQDDVERAQAALSVTKDIFIPSVVAAGGVGYSYGITLSVPTIFTLNAQSLVFSPAQRSYVRAAQMDLRAALTTLADTREQVEEDAVVTYLSLDHAQDRVAALKEEYGFASRLVLIAQDRLHAGIENELDLKKSRRAAVQTELNELQAEDGLRFQQERLGNLIGLPGNGLTTVSDSIPSSPSIEASRVSYRLHHPDSHVVLSAEANAEAKQQRASGDSRYTWWPQITFAAQYGRVSPVNNVSEFYNLHGNYNTVFAGVQIQLPLLDRVRSAAARESIAEASRAKNQLDAVQMEQRENRLRAQHSIAELETKSELAELDQGISQDELKVITIELKAGGNRLMTPEDEQNAHIREREKYLDLLDAKLEVFKAKMSILRQQGRFGTWLQSLVQDPAVRQGMDNQAEQERAGEEGQLWRHR